MLRFFADISKHHELTPDVLAATLGAGVSQTVHLNSERIEQCFGSYGIDVLAGDAELRRANLYSVEDGHKTCRTYAIVHFTDNRNSSYAAEHTLVLSGGSLGAAFKARGWNVQKETLHIGSLDLNIDGSPVLDLMRLSARRNPAMHVYRLLVAKNSNVFEYAIIAEAHHPDYLTVTDLHDIFPHDTSAAMPPQILSDLAALFADNRLN